MPLEGVGATSLHLRDLAQQDLLSPSRAPSSAVQPACSFTAVRDVPRARRASEIVARRCDPSRSRIVRSDFAGRHSAAAEDRLRRRAADARSRAITRRRSGSCRRVWIKTAARHVFSPAETDQPPGLHRTLAFATSPAPTADLEVVARAVPRRASDLYRVGRPVRLPSGSPCSPCRPRGRKGSGGGRSRRRTTGPELMATAEARSTPAPSRRQVLGALAHSSVSPRRVGGSGRVPGDAAAVPCSSRRSS